MSTAVLSKCPGCKKVLRMPEEWADKTVKCKFCGMVCQAKPSAALQARIAAAKAPPPPPPSPKPAVTPAPVPAATAVVASAPVFSMPMNGHAPAAPTPATPWEAITSPAAPAAGRRYRRRRSFAPTIVALLFLALCIGGSYAGWHNRGRIKDFFAKHDPNNNTNGTTPEDGSNGKPSDIPTVRSKFLPRRVLGISVNSYLYLNPTCYGNDPKSKKKESHDFGSTLTYLQGKLRIDPEQVFEVSDSASQRKPNPPIKPIIEQTVTRFVDTCRQQDDIIVIFSGHAVEVNEKPYLVPLEGDLEDEKTLIPLSWLMDQLGRCQAQQKILIMDVCRYDPARGFERASGGKMTAKFEAALKNPPPGVQVWSACSADQYSYEVGDYNQIDDFGIKGGVFLNMFFYTLRQGMKVQQEGDPIPVDSMAAKINPDTARAVSALAKDKQTPFFAGTMRQERVAFNPEESPAAKFDIPTPASVFGGNLAPPGEIQKLLAEIDVPPVKQARDTDAVVKFDAVVPFPADALKEYADDGISIDDIKKNKEKYPLRFATIDAVEKMRLLKETEKSETDLPDKVSQAEINDATKNALVRLQRGPARVMLKLRTLVEDLDKAAEERKQEKSKRWQANFDYVSAMAKARLAYVHEYSLMSGSIRKEDLPEIDPKLGHDGWRLSSQVSLSAKNPPEIKDLAKDAKKAFNKLATDHKGTPWEVLGKRQKQTALGLKWVPTGLAEDVNVK